MTDKVQKIREEVERLQNELIQEKKKGFGSDADDACILELQNVLTYIDSLQEDPQVKESAKVQHINETCKESVNSLTQEPVSEELEEASKEWLRPQLDKSYANYGEAKMMELTHFDGYAMLDAIEFGAKWQKAKDQKK